MEMGHEEGVRLVGEKEHSVGRVWGGDGASNGVTDHTSEEFGLKGRGDERRSGPGARERVV